MALRKRLARYKGDYERQKYCSFDKGGSPPAAPAPVDPSVAISAQAKATPSQYTPYGNIVYSGDPNVAGSYKATTTLTPTQQNLLTAKEQIAQSLLGKASGGLAETPTSFSFNGATDPTQNQAFQAQRALLDPVWKQNEDTERSRLINQGIPEGSQAYNEAMRQFAVQRDSAYQQAAASAEQQGYGQALGTRQQNINEIAMALGQPVGSPASAGGGIDTTTPFAAQQAGKNTQYQGQLAGYNAGVAGNNATMGGLFSLGAAALLSDRRAKKDIKDLGELIPGIHLYEFSYLWSKYRHKGVMADEIEPVFPQAVHKGQDGYSRVDYSAVMRMLPSPEGAKLREAVYGHSV